MSFKNILKVYVIIWLVVRVIFFLLLFTLSLNLIDLLVSCKHQVSGLIIKHYISCPWNHIFHWRFGKILNALKPLERISSIEKLIFNFVICLRSIQSKLELNLISIIGYINESIIKEESGVAFLTITIVDGSTLFEIFTSFNDETLELITIVPGCLSWPLMVQHISKWYESICFYLINCDTENSTCDNHSDFLILCNVKLFKVWNLFTKHIIVLLNFFKLLFNWINEPASF